MAADHVEVRPDARERAAEQRSLAADGDRVVAGAGRDHEAAEPEGRVDAIAGHRGRPVDRLHVDLIVPAASLNRRRPRGAGVGARDRECVVARAQSDVQGLEVRVRDRSRQPETRDRGARQRSCPADGVARLVDVELVTRRRRATVHGERALDAGERAAEVGEFRQPGQVVDADAGQAADVDDVAAGAGEDVRRVLDRPHGDVVVPRPCHQVGGGRGPEHVEHVVALAGGDVEGVDVVVVDAVDPRRDLDGALERRGVDLLDLLVRERALERDRVRVAVLIDGDIVGERQRRVGVVGVEHGAQGRQQVGRRGVRADQARGDVVDDARAVGDEEVEDVAATTRRDGQRLDVREIGRRRALVQLGDGHVHRRVRARDQTGGGECLGPLQRREREPGVGAGEPDRVRDVGRRPEQAHRHVAADAEELTEREREARAVEVEVERTGRPVARGAQLVGAARGPDLDRLLLTDARHLEPGERGVRQGAGGAVRGGRIVDVDGVAPGSGVDRQQTADLVDARAGRADVDRVVAGAGVNRRVAADRLHVDRVVAGTGHDRRRSVVRALDRDRVVPGPEVEVDRLEVRVRDPSGHGPPGHDRVAAHPQAGERVLRQHAGLVRRIGGVVDVERVDLLGLDDPRVEVERREVVLIALAGDDRLSVHDRPLARERHGGAGDERGERADATRRGEAVRQLPDQVAGGVRGARRDRVVRLAVKRERRAVDRERPLVVRLRRREEVVGADRPPDRRLGGHHRAAHRGGALRLGAGARSDREADGEGRVVDPVQQQLAVTQQADPQLGGVDAAAVDSGGELLGDRRSGLIARRRDRQRRQTLQRQAPRVARLREPADRDRGVRPGDVRQVGLARGADELGLRAGDRLAVDGQAVDGERRRVGERQDVLRDRRDVELLARRGPVEEGRRVREAVHPRIETGPLAVERRHVDRVRVADRGRLKINIIMRQGFVTL